MMSPPSIARGARVSPDRRRTVSVLLATLLVCGLWLASPVSRVDARTTMAQFTVAGGVSDEEAHDVMEGVRLAQDFFIEEIGVPIDGEVHVTVLPGADRVDVELVAASMGRSIVVYTGSVGWQLSAPSEKVATIVHEYTHYYQYLMTGLGNSESPAWFEEGLAEYLSLIALSDLEIVDRADIESYRAGQLSRFPPNRRLSELESFESFNATGAAGYPLAYFGVAKLFEDAGLEAVSGYYSLLAAGTPFGEAFTLSFGLTPNEHYQRFDRWVSTMGGASEIPADVAIFEGVSLKSPVRIVEMPELVAVDEQILIRARTVEASACSLSLIAGLAAAEILERSSFADGDGDIFWLLTIPPDASSGVASMAIDCGGEPVSALVLIE